jgi:hypothetical protein
MVTAPLMALIYDRVFLSSIRATSKRAPIARSCDAR